MNITVKEGKQLARWIWLASFSFLIAINIREILMKYIPNPIHQVIAGVIGLLIGAYIFDLTKYAG